MIPIPKKNNANECKFFKTISLLPHASKIMLKIFKEDYKREHMSSLARINLDLGRTVAPEML